MRASGFVFLILIPLLGSSALGGSAASDLRAQLRKAPGVVGCFSNPARAGNPRCVEIVGVINSAKVAYVSDRDTFVRDVSAELSRMKRPRDYVYLPILVAALSGEQRFAPMLEKVAQLERKEKLKFRYAERAVERLKTGACTTDQGNYQEICRYEDQEFTRIRLTLDSGKAGAR